MIRWFILDEWGNPVPVPEDEWLSAAVWLEAQGRVLRKSWLGPHSEIEVSTVFLGLDHGFHFTDFDPLIYRPTLWETMVFQTKEEMIETAFGTVPIRRDIGEIQERYTSREEALEGHQRIVDEIASTIADMSNIELWKTR